jgi:hypothetical protein
MLFGSLSIRCRPSEKGLKQKTAPHNQKYPLPGKTISGKAIKK